MKKLYVVTYVDKTWHTREKFDTSQENIKEAKRFAKEFDEDESPLIEVYAKIGEIKPKKGKK